MAELEYEIGTIYFKVGKADYMFYVSQKSGGHRVSIIEEEEIKGVVYVMVYSADENNSSTLFWKIPSSQVTIKYKNF